MPRVLTTPTAERDLVSIGSYIPADNPDAADRLLATFQEKFERLAEFPRMGQSRPELAPSIHSYPIGNYLVFYLPLPDGIDVVRVLHGARNLRRIFRRR